MKYSFSGSLFFVLLSLSACANNSTVATGPGDSTIKVPAGFKVNIFADELGRARHMAINSNGDVYVKLERVKDGKGIIRLRDANKDGIAEDISGFGNYGGTGIAISNNYLYASSNEDVYRYKMENNEVKADQQETVVKGLINRRQHESKSIALDGNGNLFVEIGAYSNACQQADRTAGSPGMDPCPILENAGGVWKFKADAKDQSYPEGERYVTGIRHIVALRWNDADKQLYGVQHGRDQLNQLYGTMYTAEQSAELPAEEFFLLKKGGDYGWPYCYYDQLQKQKVLAPEYGGDGKKIDRCADKEKPIMAFPGHWAPNDLLFYSGNQFPAKYKNGAFIAFHGSWNRAPLKQQGYCVVFVPFSNGKPTGEYEIFATGFAGVDEVKSPGQAKYRPCGLAEGPDGSLYVCDDNKGRVWKITYSGK